jgi:PAS domain S-box-containing protein
MGASRNIKITANISTAPEPTLHSSGVEAGRLNSKALDEAILEWTLSHVPQGIFTTDTELRITSWNHWLETHSRLTGEEVVGKPLAEIIPTLAERRLEEYFGSALRGEPKLVSRALHGYLLPLPSPLPESGFSVMQQSARIAPLLYEGEICGTITTIEDVTEREWQSARLRTERERAELLSETLVHLLGTHNSNAIVPYLFSKISPHLDLDSYMEYRPGSRPLEFRLRASAGISPEQQEIFSSITVGEGLCGNCLQERQPAITNHVASSHEPIAIALRQLGFRSYVALPLFIGSRVLGCVAFGSRRRDSFPPEDVLFLQACCQYAAVALDRLERETELRTSEERFRGMADTVPNIIFTARPGGAFDFINQRFEVLTGVAPAAATGFGWLGAVHPEEMKLVRDKWRASLQTGAPLNVELRLRSPEASFRWFMARAQPIRNEAGQITKWFGAITDINDLKNTELALAAAQEQLSGHAEKLEKTVEERTAKLRETILQLESFSYTVAHDLRAPIRAMEGYANVLLEDYSEQLEKEGKTLLSHIARASNRLDALTRDVLNYTRVSQEQIELLPLSLDQVVDDVMMMNPSLSSPGARIEVLKPLHSVIAQPTLLGQAISNLLDNALKFVAPGVTPHIVIHSQIVPASEASPAQAATLAPDPADRAPGVTANVSANRVRLWIEDNGIGMDEAAIQKAFHIFQRGREAKSYPGTGIGLAIVAKSLSRMDGRYGVQSTPGRGSRFWIELPEAKS